MDDFKDDDDDEITALSADTMRALQEFQAEKELLLVKSVNPIPEDWVNQISPILLCFEAGR